ncbi:hypothetical protein [Paenibacillus oleatilyticus]|uniref:Uncharacterized protein n=1 Tax=Paenibacillus oleatilyticus TaxID=2594886 RepID=A0ABV4VCD8_9BACL
MDKLNENHLKTLRALNQTFKSPTELAGEVFPEKGVEWKKERGSSKMSPICKVLVELGYAERSSKGQYRLSSMGHARLCESGGSET